MELNGNTVTTPVNRITEMAVPTELMPAVPAELMPASSSWGKAATKIGIAAVVIGGLYLAYRYFTAAPKTEGEEKK